MKSTFDILTTVYKAVNPVFDSILTGGVYLIDSPDNDQNENITLNILANPTTYVQDGVLNVNIETMELEKGKPPTERLNTLLNLLIPIFHNKTLENAGKTVTLHTEVVEDKGVFKDKEMSGKYFYNLRVRFITL